MALAIGFLAHGIIGAGTAMNITGVIRGGKNDLHGDDLGYWLTTLWKMSPSCLPATAQLSSVS